MKRPCRGVGRGAKMVVERMGLVASTGSDGGGGLTVMLGDGLDGDAMTHGEGTAVDIAGGGGVAAIGGVIDCAIAIVGGNHVHLAAAGIDVHIGGIGFFGGFYIGIQVAALT